MRISRKLVGIAAAGALIAGVGVATAAPASAAKTIGTTTISVDPTLLQKLQAAGVTATAGDGAMSDTAYSFDGAGRKSTVTSEKIMVPILKKGATSSLLNHEGQIDIVNNITGAYNGKLIATCDSPQLVMSKNKPTALQCLVPMGTAPTTYAPAFTITGGKLKSKKGTYTYTGGTVTLNGATYVAAFNTLLTGKPAGLFTEGEKFGTINVSWTP